MKLPWSESWQEWCTFDYNLTQREIDRREKLMKKDMYNDVVWILEKGKYYNDRGLVVCAAKSKAAILRWIKSEYPKHGRRWARRNGEIFFENDDKKTWLRCKRNDKCPLVA